jgi:hypothetical protein
MFFVQDDLFLVPDEKKAVDRLDALGEALRIHSIRDARFWIKGRPDSITPGVLEAARRLGVIHIFLGVENAAASRLRYLGREHSPQDNVRAVEACLLQGILPSFNLMMFDPDCELADIRACLELADRYAALPWNLCRTEVYSGTRLLERLEQQRRLEGDYRSFGYRMRDDRAEVMFRILRLSFEQRSFAYDSLLNRLITLAYGQRVHEAFFPGEPTQRAGRAIAGLVTDVHRDTVERLRALLTFVEEHDVRNRTAVERYAVQMSMDVKVADLKFHERFEPLWSHLHTVGMDQLSTSRGGLYA